MDPLSDVLSLLEARNYAVGGFALDAARAVRFDQHEGIKCYAVASGACWLVVDGEPAPLRLDTGACFLLPRGRPFRLTVDLALPAVAAEQLRRERQAAPVEDDHGPYIVGGYFHFTGHHAAFLLEALPPVVSIRDEAQRAAMRWSLDRLREELREAQPGCSLIAQQLACTMLIQALRLHLGDAAGRGVGWLFALADKQMNAAIGLMHGDPAQPWTVQQLAERVGMSRSVFALRFKELVGATPIEYLTRWRMIQASQRLRTSSDSISQVALAFGYGSDSAFRKAFRSVIGCSPREFGRGARSVA